MQTRRHRIIVSFVLAGIAVIALASAGLLLLTGPRIRLTTANFDLVSDRVNYNKSISLKFDRPIQQKDYSKNISIEPATDFDLSVSSQQIDIIFKQNLRSNTEYSIDMPAKSIKSLSGQLMTQDYSYKFKTGHASYLYLDRDADGANKTRLDTQFYDQPVTDKSDDAIKLGDLDDTEETIYEARTIRSFVTSSDYIYVAQYDDENDQDEIVVIDRSNNDSTIYPIVNEGILSGTPFIPDSSRVKKMATAINGDLLLFTIGVPTDRLIENPKLGDENDALYSLDPVTGEINDFFVDKSYSQRVNAPDIHISNDGQALLVAEYDQTYGIVSPFERIANNEPLGTYDLSKGFNFDGSKILFFDKENLVLYDAIESEDTPLKINRVITSGRLFSNSNSVILQAVGNNGGSSEYELIAYDQSTHELQSVWTEESGIITDFVPSFDDQFLAVETRGYDCNFVELEYNGQCAEVETKIVDKSNSEIISTLSGFDLMWLP